VAGIEHLQAAELGGRRLERVEEARDRGHQPPQRLAVDSIGAPEVVDHLGRRDAAAWVSLVVRQLQVAHHGAVFVGASRLSQVHAHENITNASS
jgi:hypothetical protein